MALLDDIKLYCEVDDTDAFDSQLLLLANQGIGYLINNKIPLTRMTADTEGFDGLSDESYEVLKSWLCLYVIRLFDRTLMTANATTSNWIDTQLLDFEYQLKCLFDVG